MPDFVYTAATIVTILSFLLLLFDAFRRKCSILSAIGSGLNFFVAVVLCLLLPTERNILGILPPFLLFVLLFVIMCLQNVKLPAILAWIPAAVYFVTALADIFLYSGFSFVNLLICIAGTVCYLLVGIFAFPRPAKPDPKPKNNKSFVATAAKGPYLDPVAHVLLLLFTFGIYLYIWIYTTTKYTNNCPGESPRDPVVNLLLCIFVPFYSIYWFYKTAQRVDQMAAQRHIPSNLATVSLVLAIFSGSVPPILLQLKINEFCSQKATAKY